MHRVYIDGSCPKNGTEDSMGGWAYAIVDSNDNVVSEDYGKLRDGAQSSTRSELESLYRALLAIKEMDGDFVIITDYKTIVELVEGLGARNANRDLWGQIEPIMLSMAGRIKMRHINSHVKEDGKDYEMNNYVDKLAKQGAQSLLLAPAVV